MNLRRFFCRHTPEAEAARQLEEARMAELLHLAAAESHAATAKMYRERIVRLRSFIEFSDYQQPRKETL